MKYEKIVNDLAQEVFDAIAPRVTPEDMERVRQAYLLAKEAHAPQRRKSGEPYILHPIAVARIVCEEIGLGSTSICAALFHDVVEDTDITIEEIEEKFGKRVRELVQSETEDKRAELPPAATWRIRKEESLAVLKNTKDIGVLMVWLGDKLANMRSIYRDFKVEGVQMWQRFNQKDSNEQAWYYRSIVKLTERLSDTSAWLEYKTLTELVFGKGE